MKRLFILLALLLVFSGISIFFYFRNINAQEIVSPVDENKIIERLDKIMESQRQIFQKLENLQQEMKARCHR